MASSELNIDQINDLIELTKYEISEMKKNRAEAYANHAKLPPSQQEKIAIETKHFHYRAVELKDKLEYFAKLRDEKKMERQKEKDKNRGWDRGR